ncbi:MAG: hypothetical protein QMC74_04795 [Myxococcota bacterium]|jgi:hypothetical protein
MSNFDAALERFQQIDLEYAGGLANHGPMGAEALEALGHQAKIPAFVDIYAPRLPPMSMGSALAPADRMAARGDISRVGDWIATFDAELPRLGPEAGAWGSLLRAELPALMPGLFAAAGHGLLRVAHGVRALERVDDDGRRREVALGLAHWSARYQTLPGKVETMKVLDLGASPAKKIEDVVQDWPILGEANARLGFFTKVVERLDGWAPFEEALGKVALPAADDVDDFLSGVCRAAAKIYVDHPASRIAYVHGLTIPSSIRSLLPFLEGEDRSRAVGYALEVVVALHSIFGDAESEPEPDDEVIRVAEDWDEMRYHSACSIAEHSIKMVEACWREDRLAPNPIFRRAAADAALKVGGRGDVSAC